MKRKVWFMKKNIIVFFTSVILCGCASNKDVSTSDKFIPEQETTSDYNSEEMSNMNTFDNGIISSQYDSSLLQENNVNTDVLSGVAYIKYGADTSEAILNGSCVYAASTQQDSADLFSSAGAEMTKALFDGIFNIQENEFSSTYANFTLVDMDTSLAVNIYFTSTNSDTDNSTLFFNTIKQIINSCEIEKSYSGVIFNMFVDTKMTASITLTSYISPESFSSSYVVIDNNYTDAISNAYSHVFNDKDVQVHLPRIRCE